MRAMRVNASRKRTRSPASAQQCLVGGIDDRIHAQCRDVGFDDLDLGHALV